MKQFQSLFFAPLDTYPVAGMFTATHLVSLAICIILIVVAVKVSLKQSWEQVMKLTRVIAVLVTVLEGVKIAYNFYYGYTWLDAWFPLSFCSLFIYATWLSGYGKGRLKKLGDAFIVIGCLAGGVGFLLFPTTSLMRYPIWHFLCLYSLLFHLLMIYLGMMYLIHGQIPINRQLYAYFSVYFLIAASLSILINSVYHSNLMILREPYNIPFDWVQLLYQDFPITYIFVASIIYLVVPAIFTRLTNAWLKHKQIKSDLA